MEYFFAAGIFRWKMKACAADLVWPFGAGGGAHLVQALYAEGES